MKTIRSDLALQRILDALEADLLAMPDKEVQAVIAETGMSARTLLSDSLLASASSLEGEVGDTEHRRLGQVVQPSRRHRAGGDNAPYPDLRSDLPLKGGGG